MGLAMGGSQAMKTAWIEDRLGPRAADRLPDRHPLRGAARSSKRFHFGFDRVNGLGFLIAAVALAAVGAHPAARRGHRRWSRAEHVTVGSIRLFGRDVWLGWLMLAAQAYATIPPLIIGRKELPLATRAAATNCCTPTR